MSLKEKVMTDYSKLILNGCSFVKGDNNTSDTLANYLSPLVDLPIENLSLHGTGNERIVRTTYDCIEDNDIDKPLVVIGWSNWARFEFYDSTNDNFIPFNFWDNHFHDAMYELTKTRDNWLLDNEIKHAKEYGKNQWEKNVLKGWDKNTVKEFIIFYLEYFKNETVVRDSQYRQAKMLEAYIESRGGKMICFNSLECLPRENTLNNFFEFDGYPDWHTALRNKKGHLNETFRGHPSALSNKVMAELIASKI